MHEWFSICANVKWGVSKGVDFAKEQSKFNGRIVLLMKYSEGGYFRAR